VVQFDNPRILAPISQVSRLPQRCLGPSLHFSQALTEEKSQIAHVIDSGSLQSGQWIINDNDNS
jgi:hypothetical protein